jgi:hypothetical protein
MIDIGDLFHYLIGLIIVSFCIWVIVKIHNYFSQNNIPLEQILYPNSITSDINMNPMSQPLIK